jgi:isopenicillin N synthase-like dioxygenase
LTYTTPNRPYGGEGTRGYVDQKSGIYFGPEYPSDHPQAGLPLHGKNQFPDARIPEMRHAVLEYIQEVLRLGDTICAAISVSMGFEPAFFKEKYLKEEPVAFFRSWKYQLGEEAELDGPMWGIGEHSGEYWFPCLFVCGFF